ncbi:mitochondrial carrier [Westerdykella ornata]|uniref:Mitochondrial carrier n=1 Tax=Westerdykella ornata TaxID=318751 RepID=A0A6A6JI18_WESOR|nr:mitochondrial carrier [Westerdykella ornata]KAF2276300.1 mitochondrial carrier [Westerdykella ornata]
MTYVYNAQLDAFELYHVIREEERKRTPPIGPALPALGHATSGALGTAVSKLLTYPLDLLITRLQVQRQFKGEDPADQYDGILDAIETIYTHEGGITAFYSGVLQETLKGVADSFLFFLAYTYARQRRLTAQGTKRLSAWDEISVGVLAGAFAKLWTTPLQNIVTRKQAAAMIAARDRGSKRKIAPSYSTRDIAAQIREEKGLQGFWSGYSASLFLTLNPSITFLLHRVLLRLAVPKSKQADPGARLTFLLAAISKATASAVTYPFSLAKTRAQVSSRESSSQHEGVTREHEKEGKRHHVAEKKVLRARQRTVISTILHIARTEGILALYEGLGAELLKSFFSHGITMLAKDRIHALVINLYYLVLKSLKKYPSPEELTKMAAEQGRNTYAKGAEVAGNAASKAQDMLGSGREQAKEVLSNGKQQAEGLLEKGKDAANNVSKEVQDAMKNVKHWGEEP